MQQIRPCAVCAMRDGHPAGRKDLYGALIIIILTPVTGTEDHRPYTEY